VLTEFSPIAADPSRFGISIRRAPRRSFTNYLLEYDEPGAIDHGRFGEGLRRATNLYMAGIAWQRPVQSFFAEGTGAPTLAPDFVVRCLNGA
jgi:hypothetical protein